ncbi:MAG: ABC transporter permease [Atopobiaceae bacterium]|nr:ABC transporter permease [Atopobiaceae bacterium]
MSSVLLLTRLELQQAIGGARGAIEKRAGANGAMAGTALIAAALLAGLGWLGYMAYGMVGHLGLAKALYNILFIACGSLTFAFSLPSILGTFFGSSDTSDLLPLPVSPFAIVFSKALGALVTAYMWTFIFIVAPLAGWGIAGTLAGGLSLRYWVVYVLAAIFTPMMPVAYAGTISMVIAALFKRVRRKDAITTIATVLTLALSIGGFFVVNQTNSNSNFMQMLGGIGDSVGSVVMAFPAYGFAVYAFIHPDPLGSWLFVLLSVAAFAVFVLVARVVYMRIVTSLSSGGGAGAAYTGAQAQEQAPVFKALLRTEVRKVVRNSSIFLYYVVYPLVICPVLFGVMVMTDSMREIFRKLGSIEDATTMLAGYVLCMLMAFTVLSASSNKLATTAVSREGSNWIHMKFVPVPLSDQILAKVLPGFMVNVLITLVFLVGGGIVVVTRMGLDALVIASGLVLMLGGSWLMVCVGAWCESRNPNVEWGNDADVNPKVLKSTGGEMRSLLVGLVYAALPLLASPLLKLDPRVFMPVLAVAGVVAAVVLGRMLLSATVHNIEAFE